MSVEQHTSATEERIARIVDLILGGKWRHGVTAKALSDEWGVGMNRVYVLITEANKRVRAEVASQTALTIKRTLTRVAKIGRRGRQTGDLSAGVQAAIALAKIAAWDQPPEPSVEEKESTAPRTITVTYHQSVKKPEESES